MTDYDLLLTDVLVVHHDATGAAARRHRRPRRRIVRGRSRTSTRRSAAEVVDGGGKLAFPGVVDAHQHWGIYNPLDDDAVTESRACAQGGVTTALTYMRTGQYYLNKGGPYAEFFPEVLRRSRGPGLRRLRLPPRADDAGAHRRDPRSGERARRDVVQDLHVLRLPRAARPVDDQNAFLMIPEGERYDYAHFEFVMRGIQAAREQFPELADEISLSLHCETAEIMTAYTKLVEEAGHAHAAWPPTARPGPRTPRAWPSRIASYLAHETGLPNINLLHLSSRKAVDAALRMATAFPHIDFRREVTIGHLLPTSTPRSGHRRQGQPADPPARGRRGAVGVRARRQRSTGSSATTPAAATR